MFISRMSETLTPTVFVCTLNILVMSSVSTLWVKTVVLLPWLSTTHRLPSEVWDIPWVEVKIDEDFLIKVPVSESSNL